jgi:hypothetical protein
MPLMLRKAASSLAQSGSAPIAWAMRASSWRCWLAMAARMGSKLAMASGSVTRRRWLVCWVRSSVS